MPDATVIGKVAIKVVPDTGDFRGETQRKLTAIEKQLDPIKVGLELSKAAKKKVQAEVDVMTRRRTVTIAPEIDNAAAAKVASTLAALSGGRSIANLGSDIADWAGQLDKQVPKIAGLTLAITNLTSAALAGTANLFSLAGSLASTAGAGLALPGILGGIAIGTGAVIAVLKDFNDRLPEVADKFHHLQDQMSDKFWARAEEPIRRFIDELFPEFSAGIQDTSSKLGTFFANLANSGRGKFSGELKGMFDDLNRSINISSQYTDDFAGILQQLGSVGAGNLPRLARWFGDISAGFNDFLARKGQGGLQDIVDQGIVALNHLGGVVGGTGSLLAGLAKAAEESGASTLATLDATINSAARKVNGSTFQNALRNAFAGARVGIDELTDRSGAQFESLLLRISDLLSKALPKAGETAGTALGAIFDGLDQPVVESTLLGFLDDLNDVVANLAPTMPAVARGLAAVVDTVGDVSINVSKGLAPLLQSLGDNLPGLADDLDPLIEQLGELTENAAEMASGVLPEFLDQVGAIGDTLATVLRPLNDFLDVMGNLPGPIKTVASNLVSIGLIVGAGAWMGGAVRSKILGVSESLLQTSANAKVAQGSLFQASLAAENIGTKLTRARSGIAIGALAIGSMATEAAGTNDALSILSSTATGAVMGTAFGPGWGTVIGGAAGALLGLYNAVTQTDDGMKDAVPSVEAFSATLNDLTGASTEATRSLVFDNLKDSGVLESMATYGISARQVIDGVLGQAKARKELAAAISQERAEGEGYLATAQAMLDSSGGGVEQLTAADREYYKSLVATGQQLTANADRLEGEIKNSEDSVTATRAKALAVKDYGNLLKGLPPLLKTSIKTEGLDGTVKEVRDLAKQYKLTPKQVRTLVEAEGIDLTDTQIKNLIANLKKFGNTKGTAKVDIDTSAAKQTQNKFTTEIIGQFNKTVGTAKAKIDDQATPTINSIRQNLIDLNGNTATVTVNHRDIYTVEHRGGGGGKGVGTADDSGRKAGQDAAHGFSEDFAKTLDKLQKQISKAYEKVLDKAGKKGAKAVKAAFAFEMSKMNDLAREHRHLMTQLENAKSVLEGYKAQWQAMHDTVRDTIVSSADITQLGAKTYNGIIRGLTKAKEQAQAFRKVINDLIAGGLNQTTLKQILAAGPEAGLSIARAILDGGIQQVNEIQAEIDAAAEGAGTAAGQHFFGDLVSQAQDDVDKLLDQLGPLQARLEKFAHDLIESLSKALKREWNNQMAPTSHFEQPHRGGGGGNKKTAASAKLAGSAGGTFVAKQTNLTYNAAPGRSISTQEELFEALGRAGL